MRNTNQLGTGSDLIVPTQGCTKSTIFSFLLHILIRYSIHSTNIPLSTSQPTIHFKFYNISINNYVTCSTSSINFGLKQQILWQLKFQPPKRISCFSHIFCGINITKHYFLNGLHRFKYNLCKHHYRSHVFRQILDKILKHRFSLPQGKEEIHR